MNLPALLCAIMFCLLLNAAVVVWIIRRDRHAFAPPAIGATPPPARATPPPIRNTPPPIRIVPPSPGISIKVGLRQAEAELIMKINGLMTLGRERPL